MPEVQMQSEDVGTGLAPLWKISVSFVTSKKVFSASHSASSKKEAKKVAYLDLFNKLQKDLCVEYL